MEESSKELARDFAERGRERGKGGEWSPSLCSYDFDGRHPDAQKSSPIDVVFHLVRFSAGVLGLFFSPNLLIIFHPSVRHFAKLASMFIPNNNKISQTAAIDHI